METQHGSSASLNDSLAHALAAEGLDNVTGEMFLTMSAAEQATVLASLSEAHRIALFQHITESLSGAGNAWRLRGGKRLPVVCCAHDVSGLFCVFVCGVCAPHAQRRRAMMRCKS